MIREFIRENLKMRDRNVEETDFAKVLRGFEAEDNSDVKEFIDLMRKMIGILIAQSCDMAALVYQNYCMMKKTIEDISEEFNMDEEFIRLLAQHYDKNTKS